MRALQTPQRFDTADTASEHALRRIVQRLTKEGVTPILLIPPTVAPKRFFPTGLAGSIEIFDFSDPGKYPWLFSPENRLDEMHLNVAGSEKFTAALALRFAECVSRRKP